MAHDVFISYSAEDKPTADAMCFKLESDGVRCWIAPRDILPGMDWGGSIIGAIATSRVMVLLLSSNSNASTQVKREVERAVNKGVIVIPFRIEAVSLSPSLEYQLSLTHWMDALTPPLEKHLQTLSDNIRQLLSADSSTPIQKTEKTPVQPAPAPHKRPYMYLGAAALIGVIVLVGLGLWWGRGKSTPESAATVPTLTSPTSTPTVAPASTPRSEQNNVQGKIMNNQNQSVNNNAAPDTGSNLRVPVINGTAYDVARKLLIKEGWQPNEQHISYGDDPMVQSGNGPTFWNRGYRELVSCSGSALAECLFEFIDPNERVLVVVTQGEEDAGGEYHATVKRAVFKKK